MLGFADTNLHLYKMLSFPSSKTVLTIGATEMCGLRYVGGGLMLIYLESFTWSHLLGVVDLGSVSTRKRLLGVG